MTPEPKSFIAALAAAVAVVISLPRLISAGVKARMSGLVSPWRGGTRGKSRGIKGRVVLACQPKKPAPAWQRIVTGKGRHRVVTMKPTTVALPLWQIMRYGGRSGRTWQSTRKPADVEHFRASGARGVILHVDAFGCVKKRERIA